MANIRGKLYYDKLTGNIIAQLPEQRSSFNVRESTVEEDFQSLVALKERVPETVGVKVLELGDYAADFAEAQLIGIDPETQELKFEYPDLENPGEVITPAKPLSKQIEELKEENVMNMMAMVEMYETNVKMEQENTATMLAVTELYEIFMGGM